MLKTTNKFSKEVKYSLLCLFFTKKENNNKTKKTRDNENIHNFPLPSFEKKKLKFQQHS